MDRKLKHFIFFAVFAISLPNLLYAQMPEKFNFSDRYIRVAEVGQLADSINVWGDVGSSGRYLVPEGTNLPDLISFSYGFRKQNIGGTKNDFAKTQIEVKVSRFDKNKELVNVAFFRYHYHDPEPAKMFNFKLQNNDIVTIQVRRKPTFTDYVNVVAPIVGVVATSFLLIQNLKGN